MSTAALGSRARVRRIVDRIARRSHPERVILFGSCARGGAGPDSDVDLPLVMPVAGSKREKHLDVRMALSDMRVPMDVIVTRPEDFAWRKDVVGTIEWPAAHEGRVVYKRT